MNPAPQGGGTPPPLGARLSLQNSHRTDGRKGENSAVLSRNTISAETVWGQLLTEPARGAVASPAPRASFTG